MVALSEVINNFHFWQSISVWQKIARNTLWCLLGFSIGDFGTIAFFQFAQIPWPTLAKMIPTIGNGLATSGTNNATGIHYNAFSSNCTG